MLGFQCWGVFLSRAPVAVHAHAGGWKVNKGASMRLEVDCQVALQQFRREHNVQCEDYIAKTGEAMRGQCAALPP